MKILTAQQVQIKTTENPKIKLVMTLGPKAYTKCHIPGSLNIWDIETAKSKFTKDTEIIVYCSDRACAASFHAYNQLKREGYQNIWRFAGGLVEWSEAGYPLVTATS